MSSRALLRHLPAVDLVRSFTPAPVVVPMPDDAEIDRVLAEGGFASRAETIDCGACGYRTCVEHAVAIHQANSSWDMCFPLQRPLLESKVEQLEEHRTLDELTGLWNRRMFAERLVDEVARFDRYETPVSLLMIDIDRFAAIQRASRGVRGRRDRRRRRPPSPLDPALTDLPLALRHGPFRDHPAGHAEDARLRRRGEAARRPSPRLAPEVGSRRV